MTAKAATAAIRIKADELKVTVTLFFFFVILYSGPCHLFTAQNMSVHVVYRLTRFFSRIENYAIPVFSKAQGGCHFLNGKEHTPCHSRIILCKSRNTFNMFLRNNQYVYRRDGSNIFKGVKIFIFLHFFARYFTRRNFTKNTIFHHTSSFSTPVKIVPSRPVRSIFIIRPLV